MNSSILKGGHSYQQYGGNKHKHYGKGASSQGTPRTLESSRSTQKKLLAQRHYGAGGKQSFGKGGFLQPKRSMFGERKFKSTGRLRFPSIYQKKYRSGAMGKKYRLKEGKMPKSGYRTGVGGRKARLRMRALAQNRSYESYRSGYGGKKYRIKPTKPVKSSYRTGTGGRKYRLRQRALAQNSVQRNYRSGSLGKKYRVKYGTMPKSKYRSGAMGKKYRSKLSKAPKSTYRTGTGGRKYRLRQRALAQNSIQRNYRSGSFGKKYRVKYGKTPKSNYRSGAGARKSHLKQKALKQHYGGVPYRSSAKGKKYKFQRPVMLQQRYSGGGARSKQHKFVPYQLSPAYSGSKQKKHKSAALLAPHKPYKASKRGQRYKVVSRPAYEPAKRRHNATAVRVKKIAYLEKSSRRPRNKRSLEGGYQGHLTLNQILRMIILLLSVLVAVALGILASTREQWMG